MKILGIDPGIERTGFALVERDGHSLIAQAYGCITTPRGASISARLVELQRDLSALVERERPDAAAVERLVFVHNSTSALAVGQARGVILLVLEQNGIPIAEYAPSQIKQAVTQDGAADKLMVGNAVKLLFGLKEVPRPDDAADALALTVCHAGRTI